MNEKVLKTLEYNKIINMLKDEAGSDLGRMLCGELKPSNDLNEIKKNQLETDDALKRIWQKGSVCLLYTSSCTSTTSWCVIHKLLIDIHESHYLRFARLYSLL